MLRWMLLLLRRGRGCDRCQGRTVLHYRRALSNRDGAAPLRRRSGVDAGQARDDGTDQLQPKDQARGRPRARAVFVSDTAKPQPHKRSRVLQVHPRAGMLKRTAGSPTLTAAVAIQGQPSPAGAATALTSTSGALRAVVVVAVTGCPLTAQGSGAPANQSTPGGGILKPG